MSFQGFLKQSTAVDILLGPFLDDTDGKTAETGLTLSQADIKLSKNGQALAQKNDVTAAAADANGYYNCELDATDTNTVGQLTVICHEAGALPVRLDYHVVEEAVYDAMYGASAAGPLQSTTAARKLDVTAGGCAGIDWGNVENPTTAVDLSGTDIQLCDTVTTNSDMRGTDSAALASELAKVPKSDGTTTWNATALASILTQATSALTTYDPPTNGEMEARTLPAASYALASVLGALNDSVAAGDPDATTTLVAYMKQLINIMIGTDGVGTWPTESAPGNTVNLLEVIRALHTDTNTTLPSTLSGLLTLVGNILTDTGTTLPATLATAQADLDILTGADGVTLATAQGNYAPAKAGDKMDLLDTIMEDSP